MLVKILGLIDFIGGIMLLVSIETEMNKVALLVFGLIFIAKTSLGMLKEIGSWIDFLSGITLLLIIVFPLPVIVLVVIGLLLFQKGVFSLIA